MMTADLSEATRSTQMSESQHKNFLEMQQFGQNQVGSDAFSENQNLNEISEFSEKDE